LGRILKLDLYRRCTGPRQNPMSKFDLGRLLATPGVLPPWKQADKAPPKFIACQAKVIGGGCAPKMVNSTMQRWWMAASSFPPKRLARAPSLGSSPKRRTMQASRDHDPVVFGVLVRCHRLLAALRPRSRTRRGVNAAEQRSRVSVIVWRVFLRVPRHRRGSAGDCISRTASASIACRTS
jgi:hypothetical protein